MALDFEHDCSQCGLAMVYPSPDGICGWCRGRAPRPYCWWVTVADWHSGEREDYNSDDWTVTSREACRDKPMDCYWCGKRFIWHRRQQLARLYNKNTCPPCCSFTCSKRADHLRRMAQRGVTHDQVTCH